MSTELKDKEICRIAGILASDNTAVEKREQVYGVLGLKLAELTDMKRRLALDYSGAYEFYVWTLSKYKGENGANGTVESLVGSFRELKLTSVVEKISRSSNSNPSSKSIWFGAQRPVTSFTGREKELEALHELLTRNKGAANSTVVSQSTTVSGLGGIGKTELARMYAQKYRKEYDGNVIWLNSEDVNSFATSLKTLAKKHLNLNDKLLREMKESELLQMVCDHFSDKKCLIILDNVEIERFNVLASFPKDQPPDSMIPSLLITSRCTVWEFGIEVLSLGVLTEEEAVAFVQKFIATAHKDIEKIRSLIRVLQCLPLALQQAVAYIRQELKLSKDPITKYLGLFESEKSEDLLKYKKYCQDILEETTSVTWKITMQKIAEKEHGRLALNIMDLIAYFEPDNIPFVLFAGLELFSKEAANYSSERNVDIGTAERAVNLLVDYSMIEVDIEREVLNVHRLVQHVIRINKEKSKADEILTRAILLLNAKHDKRLVKALLPHLEGVWGHALKSTNVIKMNGRYLAPLYEELNEYGQYRTMHGLARDTKTVVWQVFGEAHEYAIDMQYYESLALFQMQMYEEANILLRKTLSRATELLGDEHFRTLSILNMFARNLRRQGEHEDQLQMIEKVYEIQLKIYGPDHTETLASLHNKGKCLLYLSRPDEALLLLQTVCEARVKLLGSEHKDTMGTRFSIAQVLEEQGKFKEALEIQEAVIEGLVRPLGAEHPQVLANLHYKAHTLLNLERLEEARELFQSVYEVRRRILGEVHPHTLTTAVWLSEVLQKQGKWIQALEFSEAVLEGRKRSLGAEHLLTLDAMNALG